MKKAFFAFTIWTTLLLTACASSKNDAFIDQMAQSPNSKLLTSSHWLVVAGHHFGEHSVKHKLKDLQPTSGERLLVQFDPNGRLFISGGCNQINGSWSLVGNQLSVSALSSTRMACEEHLMQLDKLAQQLFAEQTITIRVPAGLNQALLRLETKDNFYFTMKAAAKIEQNNLSYAGATLGDQWNNYLWKVTKTSNKEGQVLFPASVNVQNTDANHVVISGAQCQSLLVPLSTSTLPNGHYELSFGPPQETGNEASCDASYINTLSGRKYHVIGKITGNKPSIQLHDDQGNQIQLQGSKKVDAAIHF